ncbi:MAG: alpha/beta hydrolase [Rhizobacter sp.]|nr:alpha/beta hydrolase [Rhizobacter sp.]
MLHETRHSLPASDGYPIEVFEWVPPAPARAVVQIAHGMGEHAGRYRALARALNGVGVAVFANEHRGHGPEALRRGEKGRLGPRGFPGMVDDMLAVSDLAQSRHTGVPLILLGHSMGSFATKIYMLDHAHRLQGAALSGTVALDLAEAGNNSAWKLQTTNAPATVRRTPYDWLSRDEAEVDSYIADPMCGFRLELQSRQSMYAAYARTTQPEALRRIPPHLPLYLFVGDADAIHRQLAYFNPLVERFRAAGLSDVTVRIYEGARHEVLNETNRVEVTAHFIEWVERVLR